MSQYGRNYDGQTAFIIFLAIPNIADSMASWFKRPYNREEYKPTKVSEEEKQKSQKQQ